MQGIKPRNNSKFRFITQKSPADLEKPPRPSICLLLGKIRAIYAKFLLRTRCFMLFPIRTSRFAFRQIIFAMTANLHSMTFAQISYLGKTPSVHHIQNTFHRHPTHHRTRPCTFQVMHEYQTPHLQYKYFRPYSTTRASSR